MPKGKGKSRVDQSRRAKGGVLGWVWRKIVVKLYALGLVALIMLISYEAIHHLFLTLLVPYSVPEQVSGLPRRIDAAMLQRPLSQWAGVAAVENPRTPPSHYHRITSWIQPDLVNNCTTNGCHNPLPHGENKSVRAFLNMHATSMHCGVCHMESHHRPLDLVWYDQSTGALTSPPPALRAYGQLLAEQANPGSVIQSDGQRAELAELLKQTAERAGDVRALNRLAEHVRAIRQGRAEFAELLDAALESLPKYFRGEYGAKLAIRSDMGGPLLAHPNTEAAVRRFLAEGDSIDEQQRESLLAEVHPLRRPEPRLCHECHRKDDSLIPFEKLGYPSARARQLYEPNIFQALERIMEGQPLHLPQFVLPGENQP